MSDISTDTDTSRERSTDGELFVLGGGAVGAAVSRELQAAGHTVVLVDDAVDPPGIRTVEATPTDVETLREAGLPAASAVVVASQSDRRNLLLAQSIRVRFDTPRVVVLVNSDDRVDLFADAGHEVVCATSAVSTAVAEQV